MTRAWLLVLPLLAMAGCKREDMYTQQKFQTWDRTSFFKDGTIMRHPVPGTVARDEPNGPVPEPATITAALVERGHERYDIFCTPCHGRSGNGEGMIVQRGFPQPPSLVEGTLRAAKAGVFYDVITNGYGAMYSYASRVSPADRWAIIAYIRALQLSQNSQTASLPAVDQAKVASAQ